MWGRSREKQPIALGETLSQIPHMTDYRFTDLAKGLPSTVPFVGPETQERTMGREFDARLGANENIFGPSPKAIEAMQKAAGDVWMYGDPENHDLKMALANHHGVAPENIVVGEGIDGLLGYLVRLMIEPGDRVVTSDGAYPTFNFHVQGFGGTLHKVPYKGDHEDPSALLSAARDTNAKLIYWSNPDNPMGTWYPAEAVQEVIDHIPTGSLLILDEAYIELAPKGTAPKMNPETPGLIRMRTFSKGYAMAGARVGYAIGPKALIAAFDKIRNHFGMCRTSQIGALEALRDTGYFDQLCRDVAKGRERIAEIAQQNGLSAIQSATNFVAIDCGQDGDFARRVLAALVSDGVFVRMPGVAPLDRCIRISVGPPTALDVFATALPRALKAAHQSA